MREFTMQELRHPILCFKLESSQEMNLLPLSDARKLTFYRRRRQSARKCPSAPSEQCPTSTSFLRISMFSPRGRLFAGCLWIWMFIHSGQPSKFSSSQ